MGENVYAGIFLKEIDYTRPEDGLNKTKEHPNMEDSARRLGCSEA